MSVEMIELTVFVCVQLGDGTTANRFTPVAFRDGTGVTSLSPIFVLTSVPLVHPCANIRQQKYMISRPPSSGRGRKRVSVQPVPLVIWTHWHRMCRLPASVR